MKKRPTSLTIIAWILIVTGVLALFRTAFLLIMVLVLEPGAPVDLIIGWLLPIPLLYLYLMGVVGALALFVSGVGILAGRNWARYLFAAQGLSGILVWLLIQDPFFGAFLLQQLTFTLVIGFFLFRPNANLYFESSGDSMLETRMSPSSSTLLFLFAALPLACAGPGAAETACSGVADKRIGITREEFAPCATEIMSTLDTLQVQLRSLVGGDATVQSEARATDRRLRRLIRQIDWTDPYAETLLRWPDERVRRFNSGLVMVMMNYSDTVRYPGEDLFNEGSRIHTEVTRLYEQTW